VSTSLAAADTALCLHFGCGPKLLPGWVNIDRVARALGVRTDIDLTRLPWPDGSVAAILAEHVFEHFTFAEEEQVWTEVCRVLRPGGALTIEVPDFEWVCESFLNAEDDFATFYQVGHPDHYAGHGRVLDQRWDILQTMFFGNQNGAGQFHHSAYTEAKLRALAAKLGFAAIVVEKIFNKGGQALRAVLTR
jgi:predicted SAM-dependent methyltransferase